MERLSHPNCNTSISNEKGKFQFTAEDSIDYSKMLLTMVRDFEGDYFPSFEFEKSSVDIGRVLWFMLENRWIPLITGIVYLMGIFIVQEFMKKRKPLELKWPLFIWNLTIGLFSLIGFVRTAPDLLQFFGKPNGFYESACAINSSPRFAFWAIMFAFSKIPELVDTLFIVLRKKPVEAVQWFHHVATMSGAWICAPYLEPVFRYMVVINYGVHSIMYPYFALRVAKIHVPRIFAKFITSCQFAQMVICLVANSYAAFHYITEVRECYRHPVSLWFVLIVNVAFFVMFGNLFNKLVVSSSSEKNKNLPEQSSKKCE